MRRQVAAAALAAVVTVLSWPAPASAADRRVTVSAGGLPQTLAAADGARTLTVVASADSGRCRKVRWSLVLSVTGIRLNQVSVDRIEDNGSVPVRVDTAGDTARITDVGADPGRLCRNRTVTARYRLAVDDGRDGRLTYRAQAFDVAGRLLQEAGGSARVAAAPDRPGTPSRSPRPEPTAPSATPSPETSPSAEDETAPAVGADDDKSSTAGGRLSADRAAADGGIPSLFGPGLIIGALLVFVGVGLLIRLRGNGGRFGRAGARLGTVDGRAAAGGWPGAATPIRGRRRPPMPGRT